MASNTLLSSGQSGICSVLDHAPSGEHSIVSKSVLTTPGIRITLFHFAVGQELSEHTSKARAIIQILSGSCLFSVNGTEHHLKTGDLLHLPPSELHAVKAEEAFSMLLTQVTEANSSPQ